jgi:hypothetical protein
MRSAPARAHVSYAAGVAKVGLDALGRKEKSRAERPRAPDQRIAPLIARRTIGFAHEQPSVGVDAHDCFAHRNVAELTIELDTMEDRLAGSRS